jgi:hypothetical protein
MALPIGRIGWDQLPGLAKDIGVAGPSIAWVIGTNPITPNDFGIFRWAGDKNAWEEVDGAGVRISVGGDGTPWVVNSSGGIFRRRADQWEQLPGLATDIAAFGENFAWVIGTNPVTPNDFGIFRWADDIHAWVEVDGAGVAIALEGRNGRPWVVNSSGGIFTRPGDQWKQLPGLAKDIGVSFDGSVWVIGTNLVNTPNDFGVFRWDGTEWEQAAGGGVRISVEDSLPGGRPWIVNSAGQIFRAFDIPT